MANKKSWKVTDIAGSEVFEINGEKLGVLTDVLPCGGNDVWVVVNPAGAVKELLLPGLKTVIKEVDVKNKKITVQLPPGLKEVYEDESETDGEPVKAAPGERESYED